MRPFLIAAASLLAIVPIGVAGQGIKPAAKTPPVVESTKATADEPSRELFAKGVVVWADEKTKSFDLRTSNGIVRARNAESVEFLDRYGRTLAGMTLSKAKEMNYYTITMTDAGAPAGTYRFLIIVEALP